MLASNHSTKWHNSLATTRRQRATKHTPRSRCISRSCRLPVVATSEFWWEDEQEFDALTEVLLPKQVVLCTPAACQQHLAQLQPIRFVAAFSSPAVSQEAEQLWEQLGRAGPPLFLKVRTRDVLQEVTQVSISDTSPAADQFWQELAGQSWRMDLDYGLNKDATLQALTEQLLVVVDSDQSVQQLVSAAVGQQQPKQQQQQQKGTSSATGAGAGLCVVEFTGWNQGEQQQQLQSWRQLQPQLVPLEAADAALQF